jgi:hypothetical protein
MTAEDQHVERTLLRLVTKDRPDRLMRSAVPEVVPAYVRRDILAA